MNPQQSFSSAPCPDGYYRPSKGVPCVPTNETLNAMSKADRDEWKSKLRESVRVKAIDQKEYNKIVGIEVDNSRKPGDIVARGSKGHLRIRTVGPDGKLLPTPGEIRDQKEKEAKKAAMNTVVPREELRLTPIQYGELPKEGQNEYLKSLSKEERLAFVQELDVLEQEQIGSSIAAPLPNRPTGSITPPLPNRPIGGLAIPESNGADGMQSIEPGFQFSNQNHPYYRWLEKKHPDWTPSQLVEELNNYKDSKNDPNYYGYKKPSDLAQEYEKERGVVPDSERDQTPVAPNRTTPPATAPLPRRPIGQITSPGAPPVVPPVAPPAAQPPAATPPVAPPVAPQDPARDAAITPLLPSIRKIGSIGNAPNAVDPSVPPIQQSRDNRITPPLTPDLSRPDPGIEIAKIKPDKRQLPQILAKDQALKETIGNEFDRLSPLATLTAGFVDAANMANPGQTEVAPSAIAGAVSGLAAGGPIGAVVGGITGAFKAGAQRSGYEEEEFRKRQQQLNALTVQPTIQEEGGIVTSPTEPDIDIPIQAEVGEMMFFPDGRILDVMADDTHKEMKKEGDGDEVTDVIPNGTVILSNSKKRLINLEKIKDDIFTITKGDYSEDGNTPGDTIKMGDVLGEKGKKTPAELAKIIKKRFPIYEDPVEQFEKDTNKEHIAKRAEILMKVVQLQEGVYKKFEYEKPKLYEMGGIVTRKRKFSIPKYEGGTGECGVGYKKDANGNCVPDLEAMSGLTQPVFDEALATIQDPDYRDVVKNSVLNYQASMSGGYPRNTAPPAAIGKRPMLGVSSQAPAPTVPVVPNTIEQFEFPRVSEEAFKRGDQLLADSRETIESDYASSVENAKKLGKNQSARNLAILNAKLTADSLNDPNVTPVQIDTGLVGEMFPTISESEIQNQVQSARSGQNRVMAAINNSDVSGMNVGSAVASTQARLLETEGNVRDRANTFNKGQQGRRFERLKQIADINNTNQVNADNATQSNRNKLVSQIGTTTAEAIHAGGTLKDALNTRMDELKAWRQQNMNTITQSEYEGIMQKEAMRIRRAWDDRMNKLIAEHFQKNFGR